MSAWDAFPWSSSTTAIVVWKSPLKSGMTAANTRASPSGVRTAKMIAERSRRRWRRIRARDDEGDTHGDPILSRAGPCP